MKLHIHISLIAVGLIFTAASRAETIQGTFQDPANLESFPSTEAGGTLNGIAYLDSQLLMCAYEPAQGPTSYLGSGFSVDKAEFNVLSYDVKGVFGSAPYGNNLTPPDTSLALAQMSWVVDHYWDAAVKEFGTNSFVARDALQIVLWELQWDGGSPTGLDLKTGDYTMTKSWPTITAEANAILSSLAAAKVDSSYTLTNYQGQILQPSATNPYVDNQNFYSFTPVTVPEPASAVLVGMSGAALMLRRRHRGTAAKAQR